MSNAYHVADRPPREEFVLLREARHPEAKKLSAFWQARPQDGLIVGRDIPSRPIASMLSRVLVWEPINGGEDLRVRLAGAAVRRRFGRDVKGLLFSELFPPHDCARILPLTRRMLKTGEASIADSRIFEGTIEKLHQELVVFPVTAPNRIDKWVLVGAFYFD